MAETSSRLLDFGKTLSGRKFALLSDYVNSRGAADMGLLPDMLPGYTPITARSAISPPSTTSAPRAAASTCSNMVQIRRRGGRQSFRPLRRRSRTP